MLIAAPLCLLFGLPLVAVIGDPDQEFFAREAGVLIGSALLGVWSVLIPIKFWEGRRIDAATRRFTLGAVGLAFGALLTITFGWTFGLPPNFIRYAGTDPVDLWTHLTGVNDPRIRDFGPPLFFALAFGLGPWCRLADRGRRRRLRVLSVIGTGVLGLAIAHVVPAPLSLTVSSLVLMAIVLPLVSPRDEEHARYAGRGRSLSAS